MTALELVYVESLERQQSFRRRTDRGRGRPQVDDEGTLTGSSRRFRRRSQQVIDAQMPDVLGRRHFDFASHAFLPQFMRIGRRILSQLVAGNDGPHPSMGDNCVAELATGHRAGTAYVRRSAAASGRPESTTRQISFEFKALAFRETAVSRETETQS